MSEFAALALYPQWALAMLVAATALRLGRASGRGLVALSACLATWATALVLLKTPGTEALGERVLPAGMLLAGAFVHAGADVLATGDSPRRRALLAAAYGWSVVVAATAALAPRLIYGAFAARPAGPLFWPIAIVSAAESIGVIAWLLAGARAVGEHDAAAGAQEKRRRTALALACLFASLGGGGAVGARVLGLSDVEIAAPLIFASIVCTAWVLLAREHGRARGRVVQGFVFAAITAALSAAGLLVFFRMLPAMTPGGGRSAAWLAFVIFFAALPLDSLRLLVVEALGRRLFASSIGVRDLSDEVERTEARADHAERLAEIGTMASAVAHEIRNPLGVIAAQAKLLERAGASAASVDGIRGEVARAKRFLDDLLLYSKPRPLALQRVDARASLELAAERVRHELGGDAARIEIDGEGPVALEADRAALGDVATALLHNAAIAAGREGRVLARARVVGGDVVIEVEDDGPGVPREIEATLFKPFVTGRGRDARHPGTGLGLAIAARWVERHGGAVRHERPEGGGARFVVTWPRG